MGRVPGAKSKTLWIGYGSQDRSSPTLSSLVDLVRRPQSRINQIPPDYGHPVLRNEMHRVRYLINWFNVSSSFAIDDVYLE